MKYLATVLVFASVVGATSLRDNDVRDSSGRKIVTGSISVCPPNAFASGSWWVSKDCVTISIKGGVVSATLVPGNYVAHWITSISWDENWTVADSVTPLRLSSVVTNGTNQPTTYPHSSLSQLDYASAGHTGFQPTIPVVSTTLATPCSVGQLGVKTGVTPGQNIFVCTATNTWTGVGGIADPYICVSASGSSTSYTCTSTPTLSSYVAGIAVAFRLDVQSKGAMTLNMNALGAKSVKLGDGVSDPPAYNPGQLLLLAYDGTNFVITAVPNNLQFTNVRTVSGCPFFPANSIFNTDISGLPIDVWETQNFLGVVHSFVNASWSGGTVTAQMDSTAGWVTGTKIFTTAVNGVKVGGYSTGFGGRGAADVRVPITVVDSTHITYPVAADPGAYSSGGWASTGPYGMMRMGAAPGMFLNLATNATPTYSLSIFGLTGFTNTDSDNVAYPLQNSFCMEGFNSDGSCNTIATVPGSYGGDDHVLTLNTDTCRLYEIDKIKAPGGPPFYVEQGDGSAAMWDLRSNVMRPRKTRLNATLGVSSVDAGGMPVAPLLLWRDEVYGSTPITHMLRFTVSNSQTLGLAWPSTHTLNFSDLTIYPNMGTVMRLRSDADMNTCQNSERRGQAFPDGTGNTSLAPVPNIKKLMQALRHHGLIVADIGISGLITTGGGYTQAENDALVPWIHCLIGGNMLEVVNTENLNMEFNSFEARVVPPVTQNSLVAAAFVTSPSGFTLTVDGHQYQTPFSVMWELGSTHTISADAPSPGPGSRYSFSSWSDGGISTHTVTATAHTSFLASYSTQFQLTTASSTGGTITPATGTWYDAGTVISVTATSTGGSFLTFGGDLTGATNPQSLTMSAPRLVTATFYTAAPWGPSLSLWTHRKPIVLSPASGGSNLTNFPTLISVVDTNLQTTALASGNDILFTSADGATKLDHEIETYTSASGTLVAWVRMPTLLAASTNLIYMYYGNGASIAQANPTGVWDSSFASVWHLADNAGTNTVLDSTSLTHNGSSAHITSSLSAAGKVSKGLNNVSGAVDVIRREPSPLTGLDVTLSFWFKPNSIAALQGIHQFAPSPTSGVGLWYIQNNAGLLRMFDGGYTALQQLSVGTWYHLAYTEHADSGGPMIDFVNGVQLATSTNSPTGTGTNFYLGSGFGGSADGEFDEVRISNIRRTAGWIATEYANMNNPSVFQTVLPQE